MKRMKKIVSMLLAVVMVLGMSMTVFAADNNSHNITVTQNENDKTKHTYEAYQIFAGDLAEVDGKKVLSNIIWGSGVNGDALLTALKADTAFEVVGEGETKTNAFAECKTAADVAAVLSGNNFTDSTKEISTLTDAFARVVENNLKYVENEVDGKTVKEYVIAGEGTNVTKAADGKETISTDPIVINVTGSGYYLIKDKDDSVDTANGAYSRFMLEVVGDATATVKSEVPSGDKKVYVNATNKEDANNASIGSHVSFEITSKVPNYVGYNYYYFIMNDTLSEGLTFDGKETIKVTVDGKELTEYDAKEKTGEYYVDCHEHNNSCYKEEKLTCTVPTFRLAFVDIMAKDGDNYKYPVGKDIVVTYSATLNDKAKVGVEGNPNTYTLQYSNKPDDTFDGERKDKEGKPGLPDDETKEALGETPEQKTLTYATELDITKYKNAILEENLLAGAEFTLTGTSKQVVLESVDYYKASKEGEYYLLLNGTYTMEAPKDTEYKKVGVGTVDTTKGYLKNDDGTYYVPENAEDYNGKDLYKLVGGNVAQYADPYTKYKKEKATETLYVDADVSIELTTGEDGKICFKGLGAGTYTLTETVTPVGYNTIKPITFAIGFTAPENGVTEGNEKCTWTISWTDAKDTGIIVDAEGNEEGDATGIFTANVINKSGALLPSTGGIGTTIFYVAGSILVLLAVVLLVAKKRMSAEK